MNPGDRLDHYLTRFFALRQHDKDAIFLARLNRLRDLQTTRLRTTHADLFADNKLRPALNFLLTDIYGGTDLVPVATDIRRALPLATKLLPRRVMATSANALEAAIVTQELDEQLTEELGEELDAPLPETAYTHAYRTLGKPSERQLQLELINELGGHIERYIRNRLLQRAFKTLRKPVHKAGFGNLYDFMARCFEVMKPVPDAQQLLGEISHRETVIMQQIFAGNSNPFVIDRQVS